MDQVTNSTTLGKGAAEMDGYLNTSQVAERLGVTERTITRWVIDNYFPGAFKLNPNAEKSAYVIPVSDVEAFEAKRNSRGVGDSNGNGTA